MKGKITHMFLRGRFSPPTEERVQRWLVDNDDEQASREFWESLGGAEKRAQKRRWLSIAASAAVALSVAAGGIIWHNHERDDVQLEQTASFEAASAPAVLLQPLMFDNAAASEIFAALEERFGVTITVDSQLLDSPELYTIKFPKGDNLTAILQVLQDMMDDFTYTRNGGKITITASATS